MPIMKKKRKKQKEKHTLLARLEDEQSQDAEFHCMQLANSIGWECQNAFIAFTNF